MHVLWKSVKHRGHLYGHIKIWKCFLKDGCAVRFGKACFVEGVPHFSPIDVKGRYLANVFDFVATCAFVHQPGIV